MIWGLQNRISRIINPYDNRALMLAVDHGYFLGPTERLENARKTIAPLLKHCDSLMVTRGIQRTSVPADTHVPMVLRVSGGASIIGQDLSQEQITVSIEDAIRLNASALAMSIFVGSKYENQTIINLGKLVNEAERYGIPVLAVTAVGKELGKDARYLSLACRVAAEQGAHIVKTYYCDNFSKVVDSCPVPIIVAGGKKIPERDALKLTYNAIQGGAVGVDMGRNIWQSDYPVAMIHAVKTIVHGNASVDEAYATYQKLCKESKPVSSSTQHNSNANRSNDRTQSRSNNYDNRKPFRSNDRQSNRPNTGRSNTNRSSTNRYNADRPNTNRSNSNRPNTNRYNSDRPNTNRSNTGRPNTNRSNIGRPDTNRPNTSRPNTNTNRPNTGKPNTNPNKPNTNTNRPNTNTGKPNTNPNKPNTNTNRPNTNPSKPDTNTVKPNTAKPDTTKPNTNLSKPDTNTVKPDTTKPNTTKPDTLKPDTTKPDTTKPDTTNTNTTKPDTAKPDTVKSDTAKPDTPKPDTVKPDTPKPDTAKPDTVKSDTVKPDAKKPDTAESKKPSTDNQS